jgi:transposase
VEGNRCKTRASLPLDSIRRPRGKRLDAGQKRVIADRYGQGATIPELAEEYGVGVGTIWRSLQPLEATAA